MFLVDTNVASETRKSQPDSNVHAWFDSQPASALHVSAISVTEMAQGAASHADPVQRESIKRWLDGTLNIWFPGRVLPVTHEIARTAGFEAGTQRRFGRQITMADALIAATALSHQLVLVTRNTKDFKGFLVDTYDPWTKQLALGISKR